ncbi:predicted protein [Plenodomus lingam JN3]|uniref:Predicted protein n=1 Tax=Leptosphaeria maculans (strain JN3 / isolate v23.1.3 / race Av1-4-5-6-7-8) TaxID=985895 RepID=E5A3U1_LEPMJ|nr:predicted protein [Plenodomus lingam JN3]CBX98304.1 predicted protein [Plenodomus lingam JN3]
MADQEEGALGLVLVLTSSIQMGEAVILASGDWVPTPQSLQIHQLDVAAPESTYLPSSSSIHRRQKKTPPSQTPSSSAPPLPTPTPPRPSPPPSATHSQASPARPATPSRHGHGRHPAKQRDAGWQKQARNDGLADERPDVQKRARTWWDPCPLHKAAGVGLYP